MLRWPPTWLTNLGVVIGLGLLVLLTSLAVGAAVSSMAEHGVSVDEFQMGGTTAKAQAAYEELGEDGRRDAWRFLAWELPYLVSFGLLLSASCAFAYRRLAAAGAHRFAQFARLAVAFGLLSAASDLVQNSALAFILGGHFGQPAPRLAEVGGYFTWAFGVAAGIVFVSGWIVAALRSREAAPS